MGNSYPKEFEDAIRKIIKTNTELKQKVKQQSEEIKELKKKISKLEALYDRKRFRENLLYSY